MVEVFKTNVKDPGHADMLIAQIHKAFKDYKANFDLKDCDNILRIKCVTAPVQPVGVIELLKSLGFDAEILPG